MPASAAAPCDITLRGPAMRAPVSPGCRPAAIRSAPSQAPRPAAATNISSWRGQNTAAATGRPSVTTARLMVHSSAPRMKARVPSMGSTTNTVRRPNRSLVSAVSSDSQP